MFKHITLLMPFFLLLFWMLFFFCKKNNSRSQKIWTIALVLLTITAGIIAFYWYNEGNYALYYKLSIVETFTTLTFIPVVFLYFVEITGNWKKWQPYKIAMLFLPALIIAGTTLIMYLLLGEEQSIAYTKQMIENQGDIGDYVIPYNGVYNVVNEYVYSGVVFLQAVGVLIYAVYELIIYRRNLEDFFSDFEDKSIDHYWAVVKGVFALLILFSAMAITGYLLYIDYSVWVSVFTVSMCVILYYICYHVYSSVYTADDFVKELEISDSMVPQERGEAVDADDILDIDQAYMVLLPRFNQIIDKEKIFLQNDLRVSDITQRLQTNRTYISKLIKSEYQCSFSDFINKKRVEYAQELIREYPELSQEQIAQRCGYSYSSAFSRIFKQYSGMTFREYRTKEVQE